jgi:hypothetical protein
MKFRTSARPSRADHASLRSGASRRVTTLATPPLWPGACRPTARGVALDRIEIAPPARRVQP